MKIDRALDNPPDDSAYVERQQNIPWGWMFRRVVPVNSQRHFIDKEAWPRAEDTRWSSRLMASLRNEGQIRLKFRA